MRVFHWSEGFFLTNHTFRVDETLDSPTTQKNNAKSIDFTMKIKNIKFSTISPPPPRAAPGDAQIGRGAAGEQNRQKSIEKINF